MARMLRAKQGAIPVPTKQDSAAFLNGGYRVTPRFANDVCRDGVSLLYNDDEGRPKDCDIKGESRPVQERLMHPAVSAAMIG